MARRSVVLPTLILTGVLTGGLAAVRPAPAAADDWSLHIIANARLGWTDNLFSAPETPPPAVPDLKKEGDVYAQFDPGLLFTWDSPRAIQDLHYDLDTNVYLQNDEAYSITHHAGWRGFFMTSPLSEVTTAVNGALGTLNTFSTTQTAANGQVTILPSAKNDFRQADASELFALQASRSVRVTQSALATVFSTSEADVGDWHTGYRVGVGGGAERAWEFNALGSQLQLSYDNLGEGRSQANTQLTASWRRDLGTRWSSLIDGGAVVLIPLAGGGSRVVQPTVGAQIGYTPTWGHAGLTYRRTVAPDLYIRANTISDAVVLNAGLPLDWFGNDANGTPRFGFETSLGFASTGVLDSDTGEQLVRFQAAMIDVGVGYRIKTEVTVGLRYQLQHQVADANTLMSAGVYDFDRNTVLLSFYGRWPERVAGNVPVRSSLRVDRSDNTPVGEEIGTPGGDGQRPR